MSKGITISYEKAIEILEKNGSLGHTRVYATYKDGVFKGQVIGIPSKIYLNELISAYNVELDARSTTIADLIKKA